MALCCLSRRCHPNFVSRFRVPHPKFRPKFREFCSCAIPQISPKFRDLFFLTVSDPRQPHDSQSCSRAVVGGGAPLRCRAVHAYPMGLLGQRGRATAFMTPGTNASGDAGELSSLEGVRCRRCWACWPVRSHISDLPPNFAKISPNFAFCHIPKFRKKNRER